MRTNRKIWPLVWFIGTPLLAHGEEALLGAGVQGLYLVIVLAVAFKIIHGPWAKLISMGIILMVSVLPWQLGLGAVGFYSLAITLPLLVLAVCYGYFKVLSNLPK